MASFLTRSAPRSFTALNSTLRTARSSTSPFLGRGLATAIEEQPRLRLGSIAPNFSAKTTQGEIDFRKTSPAHYLVQADQEHRDIAPVLHPKG